MFGTVKPIPDELKVKEYALYRGIYCGLCRAQGKCAGGLCRLTLSYDLVFLALTAMALNGDQVVLKARRCLAHPLKKRPMAELGNTLFRCARASALLTHYQVKDDCGDERGSHRLLAHLTLPITATMRRRAMQGEEMQELDQAICASLEQLSRIEQEGCASADRAADAFGDTLEAVFCHAVAGEKEKRLAAVIGRHIGRWIYLVDALEDWEEDVRNGRYNPFSAEGKPQPEVALTALTGELIRVEQAVNLMEFNDPSLENILKNIMYLGLPARAKAAVEGKKTK